MVFLLGCGCCICLLMINFEYEVIGGIYLMSVLSFRDNFFCFYYEELIYFFRNFLVSYYCLQNNCFIVCWFRGIKIVKWLGSNFSFRFSGNFIVDQRYTKEVGNGSVFFKIQVVRWCIVQNLKVIINYLYFGYFIINMY